ncbi:MAG: glycosyltransferase family 25 protein [Oxalobacteraceae bacterium]|nr:MAG: glycosyltransferase family 25 protein [Oxalobacteraceae bacterium]
MPDTLQIYVINLDRSHERMAFVERRFAELKMNFTRIRATDGNALSVAELDAFAAERPRDGKRRWRPGQIGCFLSHSEAWQRIASGVHPFGLVLEDDLHLSDWLPRVVAEVNWIPSDADIVRLESTGQWLLLEPAASKRIGRMVRRVRSPAWGAGAYLIRQDAAAKLLEAPAILHAPVDDFLFNLKWSTTAQALNTYQLNPALAMQDKFNDNMHVIAGFGSDIETGTLNERLRGLSSFRRSITSSLRGKTKIAFN